MILGNTYVLFHHQGDSGNLSTSADPYGSICTGGKTQRPFQSPTMQPAFISK